MITVLMLIMMFFNLYMLIKISLQIDKLINK